MVAKQENSRLGRVRNLEESGNVGTDDDLKRGGGLSQLEIRKELRKRERKLTRRESARVGEFLSSLVARAEARLHNVLELGVDLLLGPLEASRVLGHLESGNGHTSALQNR